MPGKVRLYSDVEAEMANRLTNLPPFTTYCKLIIDGHLRERLVATRPLLREVDARMAAAIRQRSRGMASTRKEVEAAIEERTGWKAPQMTYYEKEGK